jgi:mRNA interferase RelE/StbE
MTLYRLDFDYRAKKEFDKLGTADQRQLQKKLRERLVDPRVVADRLSDMPDCYKIKLRAAGVRLIYHVQDGVLVVFVVAIGKRDSTKDDSYDVASRRLRTLHD